MTAKSDCRLSRSWWRRGALDTKLVTRSEIAPRFRRHRQMKTVNIYFTNASIGYALRNANIIPQTVLALKGSYLFSK